MAFDSDGTKIATGVHEVFEMLKPLVDMLRIPEKGQAEHFRDMLQVQDICYNAWAIKSVVQAKYFHYIASSCTSMQSMPCVF